jgi:hypothetical protein
VGLELPSQGVEVLVLPASDGGNDLGWLSIKLHDHVLYQVLIPAQLST